MKVGILLSGCGFYDGTEVAEAVLSALAIERAGGRAVHLSPDSDQFHTVDHLTGSECESETRHVAKESARVARGRLHTLDEFFSGELGALVIPGGHGAVKNLMTNFAAFGARRELLPSVRTLLSDLHDRRAPIASISLGRTVVQGFLGEPLSESDMQMPATEVVVDEERRLVFTPGFLTATSLAEVAAGIEKMVEAMMRLAAPRLNVIHEDRPC